MTEEWEAVSDRLLRNIESFNAVPVRYVPGFANDIPAPVASAEAQAKLRALYREIRVDFEEVLPRLLELSESAGADALTNVANQVEFTIQEFQEPVGRVGALVESFDAGGT
jgi:hypothetical protein